MRTMVGPICRTCLAPCKRVAYRADSGYQHGRWVHENHDPHCARIDVDWVTLEEYERAKNA